MAKKLLFFQERLLYMGRKPNATIAFHCLCASVCVRVYLYADCIFRRGTPYAECHFAFCNMVGVCVGRIYPRRLLISDKKEIKILHLCLLVCVFVYICACVCTYVYLCVI